MPSTLAMGGTFMPRTPMVSRPMARTSPSSHMMALPALDTMSTFSPGATRFTEMRRSLSFRLMAIRPSRRVRSYRSIDVFFTMPCSVANMRYSSDGKSFVAMTAEMVSPFSSGSRFTMAVPRAWRDASGSSYTFRRYTLPFVEKNSM